MTANVYQNRKATGSFYTSASVADYILEWAISTGDESMLEPSFGDGIFLDAAFRRFELLGKRDPDITGVELQSEPFHEYADHSHPFTGCIMDYMKYDPKRKFDCIVGNPPYVAIRNLEEKQKNSAIQRTAAYNIVLPTSSSMWMPFVIHSTELLVDGGKLGFVLPYEITYVRYAFGLWKYLSHNFGDISIIRVFNDIFPDVDVETVLFLAEKKGLTTDHVQFKTFQSLNDLFANHAISNDSIKISDIISMKKPFEQSIVSNDTRKILEKMRAQGILVQLVKDCKFKIGYVCGNKQYFHPSIDTIKQFRLENDDLIPCIINSRQLNASDGMGLDTANYDSDTFLFHPERPSDGALRYIEKGKELRVDQGYKCMRRSPWYMTPGIEIPGVILTVFGDTPKLIMNTKKYAVSNSLLSGTVYSSPKEIVCRWYNSLTLLMIEMTIHSLGGGTLVLIPGEMDKMEIIGRFPENDIERVYSALNQCIQERGLLETYLLGDEIVLNQIYGLSRESIVAFREATALLRKWRIPDNRRG